MEPRRLLFPSLVLAVLAFMNIAEAQGTLRRVKPSPIANNPRITTDMYKFANDYQRQQYCQSLDTASYDLVNCDCPDLAPKKCVENGEFFCVTKDAPCGDETCAWKKDKMCWENGFLTLPRADGTCASSDVKGTCPGMSCPDGTCVRSFLDCPCPATVPQKCVDSTNGTFTCMRAGLECNTSKMECPYTKMCVEYLSDCDCPAGNPFKSFESGNMYCLQLQDLQADFKIDNVSPYDVDPTKNITLFATGRYAGCDTWRNSSMVYNWECIQNLSTAPCPTNIPNGTADLVIPPRTLKMLQTYTFRTTLTVQGYLGDVWDEVTVQTLYPPLQILLESSLGNFVNSERNVLYDKDFKLDASASIDLAAGTTCSDCKYTWTVCRAEADWRCILASAELISQFVDDTPAITKYFVPGAPSQVLTFSKNLTESAKLISSRWRITVRIEQNDASLNYARAAEAYVVINIMKKADMPELTIANWPHAQFYYRTYQGHLVLQARLGTDNSIHLKGYNVTWTTEPPLPTPYGNYRMQLAIRDEDLTLIQYRFTVKVVDAEDANRNQTTSVLVQVGQGPRQLTSRSEVFLFSPATTTATEVRDVVALSTNVAWWEPHKDMEVLFRFAFIQGYGDFMFEHPIAGFDERSEYSTRTSVQFHAPTNVMPLYFVLYAKYLNGGETRVVHPLPFNSRPLIQSLSPSLTIREVQNVLDSYNSVYNQPLNAEKRVNPLLLHDAVTLARALQNITTTSQALTNAVTTLAEVAYGFRSDSALRAWEISSAIGQIAKLSKSLTSKSYGQLCSALQRVAGTILSNKWSMPTEGSRRYFHAVSAVFNASFDAQIVRDDIGQCQTSLLAITKDVSKQVGYLVEFGRKIELRTELSNFVAVRDEPKAFRNGGFQGPVVSAGGSLLSVNASAEQFTKEETISFTQLQVTNGYIWNWNPALTPDTRAVSLLHTTNVFDNTYTIVRKLDNYAYNQYIDQTIMNQNGYCRFWANDRWNDDKISTTGRNSCAEKALLEDVILIQPLRVDIAPLDRGEEMVTDLRVSFQLSQSSITTGSRIEITIPRTTAVPKRPTAPMNVSATATNFKSCDKLGWKVRGKNTCAEFPVCRTANYMDAHKQCWSLGAQICTRAQLNVIGTVNVTGQCNETATYWVRDANRNRSQCGFQSYYTNDNACIGLNEQRSFLCCSFVDPVQLEGKWDNTSRVVTLNVNADSVTALGSSDVSFLLKDFVNPNTFLPSYLTDRDTLPRNYSDVTYVRTVTDGETVDESENITLGQVESIRPLRSTDITVTGGTEATGGSLRDLNVYFNTRRILRNGSFVIQLPRILDGVYNILTQKTLNGNCDIKVLPGILSVRTCAEECSALSGCIAGSVRAIDGACVLKSCSTGEQVDNFTTSFTMASAGTTKTLIPFWTVKSGIINYTTLSVSNVTLTKASLSYDDTLRQLTLSTVGIIPANSNISLMVKSFGLTTGVDPGVYPLVATRDGRGTTQEAIIDFTLRRTSSMYANVRPSTRYPGARGVITLFYQTNIAHAPFSQLEVRFPPNTFTHAQGYVDILRASNDTLFNDAECSWNTSIDTLLCQFQNVAIPAFTKPLWVSLLDFTNPTSTKSNLDPGVYPVFRINERVTGTQRYTEKASVQQPFNPPCDLISPTSAPSAPTFTLAQRVIEIPEDTTGFVYPSYAYNIVGGLDHNQCEFVNFRLGFPVTAQSAWFKNRTPRISQDGDLYLDLGRDYNGPVSINVTAQTDSGTWSASQFITVTILPVNDPPQFQLGPDLVLAPNDFVQVNGWIYDLRGGPTPDEDVNVTFSFDVRLPQPVILPTDAKAPRLVPDAKAKVVNLELYSGGTTGTQTVDVAVIDNGSVNNRSETYHRKVAVTNSWLVLVSANQTYFEECRGVRIYVAYPRILQENNTVYTGSFSSNIPELANFWTYQNQGVVFAPGSNFFTVDIPQWILVRYAVDPLNVSFVSTRTRQGQATEFTQGYVTVTQNTQSDSDMKLEIRGSWGSDQGVQYNDPDGYVNLFTLNNKQEAQIRVIPKTLGCGILKYTWKCTVNRDGFQTSSLCDDLQSSGALNKATLSIPPRSMTPGMIVQLEGTVEMYFGRVRLAQATIYKFFIQPKLADLNPAFVGGSERYVSAYKAFTVDATSSRDASYGASQCPFPTCQYKWSVCRVSTLGCGALDIADERTYFSLPSTQNVQFLSFGKVPSFMVKFSYIITLTMISNISQDIRSADTTQRIVFIDDDVPELTITRMFDNPLAGEASPRLNPSYRLILQGSWEGQTKLQFPAQYNNVDWDITWTAEPPLTKPFGRDGATVGSADRLRLVVREDMHDVSVPQYRYTLTSSATVTGRVVSVKSVFLVNTTRPINSGSAKADALYLGQPIPPAINATQGQVTAMLTKSFSKFNTDPLFYRYAFQLESEANERSISIKDQGAQYFLSDAELPSESFFTTAISKEQTVKYIVYGKDTEGSTAFVLSDSKQIKPPSSAQLAQYIDEIFFMPELTRDEASNAMRALRSMFEIGTGALTPLQQSRLEGYLARTINALTDPTSIPDVTKTEDVLNFLSAISDASSLAGILNDTMRGSVRAGLGNSINKFISGKAYLNANVGAQFMGSTAPLLENFNKKGLGKTTGGKNRRGETEAGELNGILGSVQHGLTTYLEDSERRSVKTSSMEAVVTKDSPYRYEGDPIVVLGSTLTTGSSLTQQVEKQHATSCGHARRILRRMVTLEDEVCTSSSVREESMLHTALATQPELYINRAADDSVPQNDTDSNGIPIRGALLSIVVGHTFRMKNYEKIDIHGMEVRSVLTIPTKSDVSDDMNALMRNNTQCSFFNEARGRFWSIPSGSAPNECLTDHFTDFALRALPPTVRSDPSQVHTQEFPWWAVLLIISVVSGVVFLVIVGVRQQHKEDEAPVENYTAPPAERDVGESVLDAAHNGRTLN